LHGIRGNACIGAGKLTVSMVWFDEFVSQTQKMPSNAPKTKKTALDRNAPVAREYTIHLHKHIHGEYVQSLKEANNRDGNDETKKWFSLHLY
jgi:6-phosphogluconolactonase/glucosamine-6-phosphate isomerase/deaminase